MNTRKRVRKVVPITQAPDEILVDRLRDWLGMAERGELRSVALCGTAQDGGIYTCIINNGVNGMLLLGAIERMKLRYHNDAIEVEAACS